MHHASACSSFCRWIRIRQRDRPNDPGRIVVSSPSVTVRLHTSVCERAPYVFVFVSASPRVCCVHTNRGSEGRHDKKLPEAFELLSFFLSTSSCVAPQGKVKSKQRGDALRIVAGIRRRISALKYVSFTFSPVTFHQL